MPYQALIFVFLMSFFVAESNAQTADLLSIRQTIESKFWVNLDTIDLCEIVILNGIPFEKTEIDAELRKLRLNEILVTALADLSSSELIHRNCSYVIILGTGHGQSREDKERILDSVKSNLNTYVPKVRIRDYLCDQCVQVVVDGRPLGIYETQEIVNRLTKRDVRYIATYASANPKIYGRNAKNGLIEVYLTDKAKRRLKRLTD